ncbi:MAG TPA: VOC family protein [Acidimicrobiales bacterium]
MPERDRYIPGVPCWVDTLQPDPKAAARFYGDLFGWEVADVTEGGADGYLIGRIRGGDVAGVGSVPPGSPPTPVWNTYVSVDSVDATVARARDAGATVVVEPYDVMDLGRSAVLADPHGAAFGLWEPEAFPGARVVNEHGALNFNGLATRDPEAAEAFYSAVFGWRLLRLPEGPMWALPGYGDHLEELSPGLHEQMAQMGAPEGFIDVVAAIDPIGDDDADTPAHWNITFGTEDVRATAARAEELGGRVEEGPLDAPWSRTAVIADPQGARFIASQFVPENKDLAR